MKFKILLFIFFIVSNINSQNFTINSGERFKPEMNSEFSRYIDTDTDGIYIERTSLKGSAITHLLQKIDSKTLKTLYNKDLALDGNEKIIKSFLQGNKIIVVSAKYEKKESKKKILLREYLPSNGNINSSIKELASLNCESKRDDNIEYYIFFSPDELKMALVTLINNNGTTKANYDVYETNTFKKLWNKNTSYLLQRKITNYVKSSFYEKGHETLTKEKYKLTNEGTILYSFAYISDIKEMTGALAYQYVTKESDNADVKTIALDKLDVQNCNIEIIDDRVMICGTYTDLLNKQEKKDSKEISAGIYSILLDPKTNSIVYKNNNYFTDNIKKKLDYSDGSGKKLANKKFISENIFIFHNAIYLIESHITYSGSNIILEHERELLISKFNKNGILEWMQIIPKYTTNEMNGYNYITQNDKIHFFYSEHPDNLKLGTVETYDPTRYNYIYHFNKSVLACTTLTEDGILSRKEIPTDNNWFYKPTSEKNIITKSDSTLIIRMLNNAEERYDKIIIN